MNWRRKPLPPETDEEKRRRLLTRRVKALKQTPGQMMRHMLAKNICMVLIMLIFYGYERFHFGLEITICLATVTFGFLLWFIFLQVQSIVLLYWRMWSIGRNNNDIPLLEFGTTMELYSCVVNKKAREATYIHLTETLLPNAQNWKTLTSTQTRFALKRLIRTRKPELLLAVLQSLERGGTRDAIPFVEALANGKFLAAKDETIRRAAQGCLVPLRERAEATASEQDLLRPSASNENPATLLRSSSPANETDPAQLLRATTGENISE